MPAQAGADQEEMHGDCRHCGSAGRLRLVEGLAVCDGCANSPLCDRCGHPRGEHGQVFVRGVAAGCGHVAVDVQSLTRSGCDCDGFAPVNGPLRDASFAEPDPDPLTLGLRLAGPPEPRTTM